jgi:ParB family transcriptional regulator, chromosome partitioning protein
VTKDQILQAVTEGVSREAAGRLPGLTKGEMASKAETLLVNSRWVPEPLRNPTLAEPAGNEPTAEAAAE